jgi:hypothetical protein
MHETLHKDVKGYIDMNNKINETSIIKGWCFHTKNYIFPLRVIQGNNIINVEVQERIDVADFYRNKLIKNCGWKFKCSTAEPVFLQMEVDGVWNNIFSFTFNNTESNINVIDENKLSISDLKIEYNSNPIQSLIIVDNFYKNPDDIRKFALSLEYNYHKDYHKGKRTDRPYRFDGLKEQFEKLMGNKIKNWEQYGTNGVFQTCVAGDQLVYHIDQQQYAGIIFLTPDAPPETGTTLYRSKHTKKTKVGKDEHDIVFKNGFLDSTEFDVVDVVGNVYNRLILFDSQQIHSATEYFGNNLTNGRLFQLFFFDLDI